MVACGRWVLIFPVGAQFPDECPSPKLNLTVGCIKTATAAHLLCGCIAAMLRSVCCSAGQPAVSVSATWDGLTFTCPEHEWYIYGVLGVTSRELLRRPAGTNRLCQQHGVCQEGVVAAMPVSGRAWQVPPRRLDWRARLAQDLRNPKQGVGSLS